MTDYVIDFQPISQLGLAVDLGTTTVAGYLVDLSNGQTLASKGAINPKASYGEDIISRLDYVIKSSQIEIKLQELAVDYQTINKAQPTGICGSGVLDALAQLYLAEVIDGGGRLARNHLRVRITDNQAEFVAVDREKQGGQSSIVITQKDGRELQLAKAAIRTDTQLLFETNGFTEKQIKQVIIAGSFGSYIELSRAVTMGLLPTLLLNYFHQAGNATGIGAKLTLVSLTKRKEAQDIASRAHYIELADTMEFKQTFIEASHIGQYWISHGKKEVLS